MVQGLIHKNWDGFFINQKWNRIVYYWSGFFITKTRNGIFQNWNCNAMVFKPEIGKHISDRNVHLLRFMEIFSGRKTRMEYFLNGI